MVVDYLKKFNRHSQALVLDGAQDALDRLLKKLTDAEMDVTDILPLVKEVQEEMKAVIHEPTAAKTKNTGTMVAAEAPAKKGKKTKDPNAPKGALSAFMFFSNEQRSKIREQFPDLKLTEVSKKIGELWGALSDNEKKPYQLKAEEDKARATKAKEEYNAA